MSTFKDIHCTGNTDIDGNLNVQGEINKFIPNLFINTENMFDILEIGNLRGGTLVGARCVKYGRVVFLYVQINGITAGGSDVEIFRFKEQYISEYAPYCYAVFPGYISQHNNVVYFGMFNDGHFSMAIGGSGTISQDSQVMVLFTTTYITAE